MSSRLRLLWVCLRYLLIVASAVLLWSAWQRIMAVAAVQNAVERDWEISFGYGLGATSQPAWLSPKIDTAVESIFERCFAKTRGYSGDEPAKSRNRGIVYTERFRALFRGPIYDVHIYYPQSIVGDLGSALSRFPNLRRVTVSEVDPNRPTEIAWKNLSIGLRKLPKLESVDLGGDCLTDDAIAPLAGHPELHSITILGGRLTSASLKTWKSIPHLESLHIEGQVYSGDSWLSLEEQQAIINALPHVQLDLQ